MLDEVYLPYSGTLLCALGIAHNRDLGLDIPFSGPGTACPFDVHLGLCFFKEAVNGGGAYHAQFVEYLFFAGKRGLCTDAVNSGVKEGWK